MAWQRHTLDEFHTFCILTSLKHYLVDLWPVIEQGPQISSKNNKNIMATSPGNSNEASERDSDTENLVPFQICSLILARNKYHGTSPPNNLVELS